MRLPLSIEFNFPAPAVQAFDHTFQLIRPTLLLAVLSVDHVDLLCAKILQMPITLEATKVAQVMV